MYTGKNLAPAYRRDGWKADRKWKSIVRDAHAYKPRRAYPRLFVRDILRGRVTKLDGDEFPGGTSTDIPARLLLHERRAEQVEQLACHSYLSDIGEDVASAKHLLGFAGDK